METEAEERRATWFELFFDLVFVVTIAELGNALASDPSAGGFLRFAGLFVPVWWAWAGFTFYADRFDTDDLVYRLVVLVAMFAIAALATGVHDAFAGDPTVFVLAYVVARVVLVGLYARVVRSHAPGRPVASFYGAVFSAGALLWLFSLALPSPWRYAVWGLVLAVELAAPIYGWRLVPGAAVDPAHMPERFGLLTIIVLGESILAVVLGVSGTSWDAASALAAAGGFVLAAALWWTYFDFLDASMVRRSSVAGLVYMYAHLPLTLGIASLGAGVKLAVLGAGGDDTHAEAGWLLGLGVAVCMGAMAVIQLATPPSLIDTDVLLRLGTGAAALLLVPLSFVASPAVVLWLAAAVAVVAVAVELLHHGRHAASPG
jgi:low temperature requirement protein LtrA